MESGYLGKMKIRGGKRKSQEENEKGKWNRKTIEKKKKEMNKKNLRKMKRKPIKTIEKKKKKINRNNWETGTEIFFFSQ